VKILITGGNGFIGAVVVRTLRNRGDEVRCLVRPTSRMDRISGLGCEIVHGDLRDVASLRQAARGCRGLIHLAGISHWDLIHSRDMLEIVCGGTRNVLDAAVESGIERAVYVSSTIAIAGSRTPTVHNEESPYPPVLENYRYARAKHDAEAVCLQYLDRMSISIVNPGEVYGPDDRDLITAGNLIDFANSDPVVVCKGGMSICHVEDVANGMIAALDRGRNGQRYILAGENLTIRSLAELTNQILSRKKLFLTFPTPLVRAVGWLGRTVSLPLPFNPHVIPYATMYWFTDNVKAKRELGVQFRDAAETLQPVLDWCLNSGRISALRVLT
jgi:dihydroflavonol-4-reductase